MAKVVKEQPVTPARPTFTVYDKDLSDLLVKGPLPKEASGHIPFFLRRPKQDIEYWHVIHEGKSIQLCIESELHIIKGHNDVEYYPGDEQSAKDTIIITDSKVSITNFIKDNTVYGVELIAGVLKRTTVDGDQGYRQKVDAKNVNLKYCHINNTVLHVNNLASWFSVIERCNFNDSFIRIGDIAKLSKTSVYKSQLNVNVISSEKINIANSDVHCKKLTASSTKHSGSFDNLYIIDYGDYSEVSLNEIDVYLKTPFDYTTLEYGRYKLSLFRINERAMLFGLLGKRLVTFTMEEFNSDPKKYLKLVTIGIKPVGKDLLGNPIYSEFDNSIMKYLEDNIKSRMSTISTIQSMMNKL